MEGVAKAFMTYFIYLEEHRANYESAMERSREVLSALDSLSERLQAVSKSPDDTKIIQQFPELKAALMFKVLMAIDKQMNLINNIIHKIKEGTLTLIKYFELVKHAVNSSRAKSSSLSNEIPLVPVLVDHLWECATDCQQYYQAQLSEINVAHCCLDFRDPKTVSTLRKAFHEDNDLKQHLIRCLAAGHCLKSST